MRYLLATLISLVFIQHSEAKSARCFNSDDGYYNCDFRAIGSNGSFSISAVNKPTYTLIIEEPGVAFGSADFGTGRNVNLPGQYIRSNEDGACWLNNATNTKLCAW